MNENHDGMRRWDTLGRISIFTLALPIATILQAQSGDGPPNDECTGAVVQQLQTGDTIAFSGDNTGATLLDGTPFVVVWEAFELTDCGTVWIHHCENGSPFQTFLSTITTGCPDVFTGQVTADLAGECVTIYQDLAPGIWYVPVLVDSASTPIGPYTFNISAEECIPGYCDASGDSFDHTGRIAAVTVGSTTYTSDEMSGYADHTDQVAYVGTGQQYPITIELEESGTSIANSAQLLAWIDMDHDGDLDGPGEAIFISQDPLPGNIVNGTITIPMDALLGPARMRIRLHDTHDGSGYANTPNASPCGTSTFGQVHDLMVQVDLGTSIGNTYSNGMHVFPNPSDGNFSIHAPVPGPASLRVIDAMGRTVHAEQVGIPMEGIIPIRLGQRSRPGLYHLLLQHPAGETSFRIVIR